MCVVYCYIAETENASIFSVISSSGEFHLRDHVRDHENYYDDVHKVATAAVRSKFNRRVAQIIQVANRLN